MFGSGSTPQPFFGVTVVWFVTQLSVRAGEKLTSGLSSNWYLLPSRWGVQTNVGSRTRKSPVVGDSNSIDPSSIAVLFAAGHCRVNRDGCSNFRDRRSW